MFFCRNAWFGKLICFYDQNGISIDGEIENWFTDNTAQRFESYNWQVIEVDGHNVEQILEAIKNAQKESSKPTLICCKTEIGFGSPNKAGTSGVHGSPLGEEEIIKTRAQLGWQHEPFDIPEDIKSDGMPQRLEPSITPNGIRLWMSTQKSIQSFLMN